VPAAMPGAPAAIPMAAVPAPAFEMIPAEIHADPTRPGVPAAAIPEERLAVVPAIIMRTVNPFAVDEDTAIVKRVAAIGKYRIDVARYLM
jgi:hypothetical protein